MPLQRLPSPHVLFSNAVNAAYAAYAGQETADGTTGATQKNVEQPADSAAPEAVDTLSAK